MENYETLSQAIAGLNGQGYTRDFNLMDDQIHCHELGEGYGAHQFKVIKMYRFEGASNPDDNSILYAIETETGEKGILLDAYGAYSGEISPELLDALKIHQS